MPIEDVRPDANAFAPSPGQNLTRVGTSRVNKYRNLTELAQLGDEAFVLGQELSEDDEVLSRSSRESDSRGRR